jgi:hypothetical protein
LKGFFKEHLQEAHEAYHAGHLVEMQQKRDLFLCIYLLYLVGITLFTSKCVHFVDVAYFWYLRDFELVSNYAWGVAALTHLYRKLNKASHYKTKHLARYLSLLQV